MINKVFSYFEKYSYIFLSFIVFLSYGQILKMNVWQDDNALFFKLAHIKERAGYLGYGPLGDGAYKYTATPYIPIYYFWGFQTEYYFLLSFLIYILATITIYYSFSKIISKKAGLMTAILYGCGYIASDGYIRLFNSIITSVSVIFISLFLVFLIEFKKNKNIRNYFFSVLMFLLVTEFARARAHYLIAIPILYEIIFHFSFSIKNIFKSLTRFIPYGFIFYYYFVVNSDARSGEVGRFVKDILAGELYKSFSFVTTISNLLVPDWLFDIAYKTQEYLLKQSFPYLPYIELTVFAFLSLFIYRYSHNKKVVIFIYSVISVIWFLISRSIYTAPLLPQNLITSAKLFIGGVSILVLIFVIFSIPKKYRNLYLLLLGILSINIGAYSAYFPTVMYESTNRYLAHSFLAIVVIFALIFVTTKSNLIKFLIISWGIGNLISSIYYQHAIVINRSTPPRIFYSQLKDYLPNINKGDLIYFDVAEDARSYFADAFSVAQMPDTTAIAWRYGVDRYDFEMATEFGDFMQLIKEKKLNNNQIFTFFYSKAGLVNTTEYTRRILEGKKNFMGSNNVSPSESQIVISDNKNNILPARLSISERDINIGTPVRVDAQITARPLSLDKLLDFPISFGQGIPSKLSEEEKMLSLNYSKYIKSFKATANIEVTSSWQDRIMENLVDGNNNTVWQPDRLSWHDGNEAITIKLDKPEKISGFVWVNGFGNNTPTEIIVEVKQGDTWSKVANINKVQRIDTAEPQIILFDDLLTSNIKVTFKQSLNDDAPGISEIWLLPTLFSKLNHLESLNYINNPFSGITSNKEYLNTLKMLDYTGNVRIRWKSDKYLSVQTRDDLVFPIKFDSVPHTFSFVIPAGGVNLQELILESEQIPGSLEISNIKFSPYIIE